MRHLALGLIAALALFAVPSAVGAADSEAALLYVYEPGCPYCRKWEATVAPAYPNSEEGRRAPLRGIHIRDVTAAGLDLARSVRYTPTFILLEGRREVGRIEGFPGEDFFWGLLAGLIAKLDADDGAGQRPAPAVGTRIRFGE
jgi:hypothetical protein